jgi:mono/diheme cytochrome c family protein
MLYFRSIKNHSDRWISRYLPVVVLTILTLPSSPGCEQQVRIPPATDVTESTPNPFGQQESAILDGKKHFLNNCAICHGHEALGDGPSRSTLIAEPANLTINPVASYSDGRIFIAIRQGKMVNGRLTMPPVEKMSDEQIWKTITYLRTLTSK